MALSDGPDGTDGPGGLARHGAAFRGALGFLTRLPVGRREADWAAFQASPVAFPLVGYVLGLLLALPYVLLPTAAVPAPAVAAAFLAWVYLLTGINHVDGLADLGDAAVVHGGRERRLDVLKDTTAGVGAVLAVGLVLAGLALAGLSLARLALVDAVPGGPVAVPVPLRAVGVVVALGHWRWARANLGGVNGDVMGAANEIGRVVGLHAGVIAWTLS